MQCSAVRKKRSQHLRQHSLVALFFHLCRSHIQSQELCINVQFANLYIEAERWGWREGRGGDTHRNILQRAAKETPDTFQRRPVSFSRCKVPRCCIARGGPMHRLNTLGKEEKTPFNRKSASGVYGHLHCGRSAAALQADGITDVAEQPRSQGAWNSIKISERKITRENSGVRLWDIG